MNPRSLLVAAVVAGALATGPLAEAKPVTWTIDPVHSRITFTIRHFFSKVPGNFDAFSGEIVYDPENPVAGSAKVEIDAQSIDTKVEKRDSHLRSADFFDVEKYPKITFTSTGVKDLGSGKLEVTGSLTMHGVTKPVTLATVVLGSGPTMGGEERAGFEGAATVDRKEFGILWNRQLDKGGMILGDDVAIQINIEAVAKTDEAAQTKP